MPAACCFGAPAAGAAGRLASAAGGAAGAVGAAGWAGRAGGAKLRGFAETFSTTTALLRPWLKL